MLKALLEKKDIEVLMENFGLEKVKAIKFIKRKFPRLEVEEYATDGILLRGDEKIVKKAVEEISKNFNISNDNIDFKE